MAKAVKKTTKTATPVALSSHLCISQRNTDKCNTDTCHQEVGLHSLHLNPARALRLPQQRERGTAAKLHYTKYIRFQFFLSCDTYLQSPEPTKKKSGDPDATVLER